MSFSDFFIFYFKLPFVNCNVNYIRWMDEKGFSIMWKWILRFKYGKKEFNCLEYWTLWFFSLYLYLMIIQLERFLMFLSFWLWIGGFYDVKLNNWRWFQFLGTKWAVFMKCLGFNFSYCAFDELFRGEKIDFKVWSFENNCN